jgi:hypothetical protein
MKRKKFIRKVEKFASEEVSKEFRQYCGEKFSVGPILVNPDYQAYRERQLGEPRDVLITVVYEGDMSEAPLYWKFDVFHRVWETMKNEWLEDFYPFFDYVEKSKFVSGDWQERTGW